MDKDDEIYKVSHIPAIKTIQEEKDDLRYYHINKPKDRIYINSVTGVEIDFNCENEEDMYELVPDIEKYNEEKIKNCSDLNQKDKTTALILAVLLGPLGVDRFYLGYTGIGILKLLTSGCFGILWIIDMIIFQIIFFFLNSFNCWYMTHFIYFIIFIHHYIILV